MADASVRAGRDPQSVTLIAVTKTRPVTDVAALARLGVLDLGESKDQEASAKVTQAVDLGLPPLRWHLVGRLQTNKAKSVARYAHAVHSVDRPKLARALADAAGAAERPIDVFVQISLDDDPDRGGVSVAKLPALADEVASRPELRLRGVMAVPPIGADPGDAFARLRALSSQVQHDHPGADAISAGMSDDFEAAIAHGATHVRVGSALLGRRDPRVG